VTARDDIEAIVTGTAEACHTCPRWCEEHVRVSWLVGAWRSPIWSLTAAAYAHTNKQLLSSKINLNSTVEIAQLRGTIGCRYILWHFKIKLQDKFRRIKLVVVGNRGIVSFYCSSCWIHIPYTIDPNRSDLTRPVDGPDQSPTEDMYVCTSTRSAAAYYTSHFARRKQPLCDAWSELHYGCQRSDTDWQQQ